jgi:hypothetical protein
MPPHPPSTARAVPQESPLYRLVADHFDTLVQVHEEKFQRSHGRLCPACGRAVPPAE